MKKQILALLLSLTLCVSLLPAALAEEAERFLSFPRSSYPNGPMGMEEHLYYGDRMETRVLLPQQYNKIQQVSVEPSRFLVQRIVPEDSQSGGSIYRYGLVDDYGQFILPEEYTDCERERADWEEEDLLALAKDGKYAYYSLSQEKFITGFDYDTAQGFDELGIVGIHTAYDENGVPSKTLYGAVNREGKLVIPLEYSSLSVSHYGASFIFASKGEAYGNTGDGPDPQVRDGAFDYAGNPLRACVYPSTQLLSAALCMDVPLHASGEAKLKEEELSITWLPQYDWVEYEPSTARLGYRIGTEGGIARLNGTAITGPVYHYGPSYFYDSGWQAYDYDADQWIYLDPDGNVLPEKPAEKPSVSYRYDENYGFLLTDERGDALSPKLEGAYYDVAPWDAGEGLFGFVRNGKVGFSDAAGKVVIEPKYDYSLYHSPEFDYRFRLNGLAPIYQEGGGRGFIDVKGNWYDRWDLGMLSADEGPNGKYGYRDEDWNLVVPYLFDNVGEFKNGYALVRRDGVYGLLKDPRAESTAEEPVPAPASGTAFTDVPAGSWFEQGVALCAQSGIMVGTGEGQFSPNAVLTEAECLTLALRLYDLQRDGSGTFLSAPEGAGYMTLTLQDGTVFEGYGTSSSPFWTWAWTNGNWGVCVKPLGETSEEQEAWGKAHEGSAVFTVEGTEYPGTVHCWTPTVGWALMFQPSDLKNGYALLGGAVSSGIPAPGVWWRDAVYTAHQWGLDYQSAPGINDLVNPHLEEGRPARREEFAKALFDAAGELEQLYAVDWLPDLERSEWNESIFKLYGAGILGGVDNLGTFQPDKTLTRAEAAVMVARVLDPSLRLKEPPQTVGAYERAVLKLRNGYGYCNEQSFDIPTSTVFLFDGGVYRGVGNLVLIGKAGFAKGEGETVTLPCPPYMHYGTGSVPPDTAVLSDDGKTFTYTYTFTEAYIENGLPVRPAGTYTYTVDMATGEAAENAPTLPQTGYDRAVAELRGSYGYMEEYEDTREYDECTIFIYDIENGADTHRGAMRVIFKPGSALGDGTVIDLPYVSDSALRIPAERYGEDWGENWSLEVPRFTWSYYFDTPAYDYSGGKAAAVGPGLTTFALDLTTGKISKSFQGVSYENAREHVLRKRAVESGQLIRDRHNSGSYETESPICSVMRVCGIVAGTGEDERNPWDGMEDFAYYLIYKAGGPFPEGTIKRLPLPSTEIVPGLGSYYPTSRIALEESMSPDGSTFTYVYRFAWPLSYTDGDGREVTLHDAGTYTYTVDLSTGETSVRHESLETGYTVEKDLDNDIANVKLVYTQPHGVKDYQLLVTEKATGLLYHAVLPTTQVITLPDGSLYTPTTVAPNTILLDDRTGWVDYIYRFDQPLKENGVSYHEAGIYTYYLHTGSSGSVNFGSSRPEMTYGEMLEQQLDYAREVNLQAENSQCTFLLTTRDGSRGYVYSNISLIFKPGSALGEGIVMSYPSIRHGDVTYIPQVTVDEKAMILTYSYRFDEPLTSQYYGDSGQLETKVDYAAGTHAYTVDLTTGKVTEDTPNKNL